MNAPDNMASKRQFCGLRRRIAMEVARLFAEMMKKGHSGKVVPCVQCALIGTCVGISLMALLLMPQTLLAADYEWPRDPNPYTDPIELESGQNNFTVVGDSNTGEISGVISGSGNLTKAGTGTLMLTGDNTYTGGTMLTSGTIIIGRNTALGAGTLSVIGAGNHGTIRVLEDSKITNHFQLGDAGNYTGSLTFDIASGKTLTITGVENTSANYFLGSGGAINVNVPGDMSDPLSPISPLLFTGGNLVLSDNKSHNLGGAIGAYFYGVNQPSMLNFCNLSSLTFTNNIAGNGGSGNGGGIFSYSSSDYSSVTLGNHVTFESNIAGNNGDGYGGGIYSYSFSYPSSSSAVSVVTLGNHVTFADNMAGNSGDGYGGGIYSYSFSSSSVTLGDYVAFESNIAGNGGNGSGGGIFSESSFSSSAVSLGYHVTFMSNVAGNGGDGYGGGIFSYSSADSSAMSMGDYVTFTNNIAGADGNGYGGGIYSYSVDSSSVTLGDYVTFTNNIAGKGGSGSGGGIYSEFSSSSAVSLGNHVTFTDNVAGNVGTGSGGGIYSYSHSYPFSSSSVILNDHVTFGNNIAGNSGAGYGGGIYSYSFSSSAVSLGNHVTFENNIAGNGGAGSGGGIFSESSFSSSAVTLGNHVTFTDNIAGNGGAGSGGGIYSYSSADASAVKIGSNAYLTGNRAGGGGWGGLGGALHARSDGGGVSEVLLSGHTFFAGNLVSGSGTDSFGGAIYNDGGIGSRVLLDTGTDTTAAIAFSGNKVGVDTSDINSIDPSSGAANSIHLQQNTLLGLSGDGNIYFDDPISSGTVGNNSLSKSGAGLVQFAGDSVLNQNGAAGGDVTISAGTFRVVDGATFSTGGTDSSRKFNVGTDGTLAGGGTIVSKNGFTISGTINADSDRFEIPTFRTKGDVGTTEAHYNFFENDRSTTIASDKAGGTLTLMGNMVFSDATIVRDAPAGITDKVSVIGAASIETGRSLSISVGSTASLDVTGTMDFNGTGKLNISGYTPNYLDPFDVFINPFTVITTTDGVLNLDPAMTTVTGQSEVDYLSVVTSLSDDAKDVMVAASLSWYSGDPVREAHGDFTVASGQTFRLDAVLADNSGSTNRREGWDGNSLVKQGGGTLILTNDNIYSGNTTISGGTLQIGNGGTSGSIAGDIANNANLTFNRSNDLTYAGMISGSGNLTKAGTGTLILTGDNIYTGGTTISGGTLQIGNGGTSGSIAGDIANNANLTFNRSDDLTYAGMISGSGNLNKAGTGTLTLTGDNSYSGGTKITGGSLVARHVNALGSGAVDIGGNTLSLDFDGSMNTGNALSGTGRINILGDIDINHANTGFTGTARVGDANRLTLGDRNALQHAAVVLGSGSTLRTIQASDIRALASTGGILDLRGDLTVAERASLTDTGYHVALSYDGTTASTDKLLRAKTIDIAGGTLDVDSANVDTSKLVSGQSVRFKVMESTDGLTGMFGAVTGANKLFSLTQNRSNLNLFVDLQYVSETPFSFYGDRHNIGEVAGVLNWAAQENPGFIQRFAGMDDTQIGAWMDGARGSEIVADAMTTALHSPWQHAWSHLGIGRLVTRDSNRGWVAGIARDADVSSDGNAHSYETYRRGAVVGYDHAVTDDVLLGAQMLYADDVLDSTGNRLEGEDMTFAVYTSAWVSEWLRADGFVGYGIQDYGYRRVDASGWHNGQYDGRSMYGSLQFSTPLALAANVTVGPMFGLDYQRTKVDSITEGGSTDGQLISESEHDLLTARIGVAAQALVADKVQWKGRLNYGRHIDGDNRPEIGTHFASLAGSPEMRLHGINLSREYVEASAGIEVFVDSRKHLSAFGDYEYKHAGYENSHAGRFGIVLRW